MEFDDSEHTGASGTAKLVGMSVGTSKNGSGSLENGKNKTWTKMTRGSPRGADVAVNADVAAPEWPVNCWRGVLTQRLTVQSTAACQRRISRSAAESALTRLGCAWAR